MIPRLGSFTKPPRPHTHQRALHTKCRHPGGTQQWAEMGYLFGQKRRKVGRLQRQAARCFLVTQEASSVGAWHVVLAARGADRKTAADGIRAVSDEASCAVVWCATDPASWSQQLDLAIVG